MALDALHNRPTSSRFKPNSRRQRQRESENGRFSHQVRLGAFPSTFFDMADCESSSRTQIRPQTKQKHKNQKSKIKNKQTNKQTNKT
jgi:hypothetical protein